MSCRNALLILSLTVSMTWAIPSHTAPEETAVDSASSRDRAGTVSEGETDWDWDDLDVSGSTPSEEPALPEFEADTDESVREAPLSPAKYEAKVTEVATESPETAKSGATNEDPGQPAVTTNYADDWDWDNIEEAAAEPVTDTARRSRRNERMAALAKKPRPASTAEADFESPFDEGYSLFQGVGSFQVIPSRKDSDMHPCLDCHEWAESELTKRSLKEPHDNFKLEHGLHGKGEFWCFTCHHLEGDGGLRTLEGLKLSFDEAYILCSQCHAQESKDWYFGAHGKRIENWSGTRQILNCTACHYQHRPELETRKPLSGPTMRMGMDRPTHWVPKRERGHNPTHRERVWERYTKKQQDQPHE